MEQNESNVRSAIQPVNVQPMFPQPPAVQNYPSGDVEIIDLDDPRRDVKPTTWHRK